MVKLTLLGAGGGVGQPLSLLLRFSPYITTLALYSRHRAPAVAADLSQIPSPRGAQVQGHSAAYSGLVSALQGAEIVILAAGPGVTADTTSRDALFAQSASAVSGMVEECARVCPGAVMLVVTNPVNAIVPFVASLLEAYGVFGAGRLFGVTTLDVVRAESFLAEAEAEGGGGGRGRSVEVGDGRRRRRVDVVGGHSPQTIVPLMSVAEPAVQVGGRELEGVVNRVRFGGREVYYAKGRNGTATLSTAYATLRITDAVCEALLGKEGAVQCAYVHLSGIEGGDEIVEALGVDYFAMPVEFGMRGASRIINPLGAISSNEQILIDMAVPALRQNIKTGLDAAQDYLANEKSH